MADNRTSDAIKAFLENQKEENAFVRHYEEIRFKITQLTITLSGLLLGVLRFGDQQIYGRYFGFFIAILGFLGAIVSAKYTERADRHATLARAYRRAVSDLIGKTKAGQLETIHQIAATKHVNASSLINQFHRTRARIYWIGIHICMIGLGIAVMAWHL